MSFKHITYSERQKIEVLYNKAKKTSRQIAVMLGYHYSTIYREIKRGLCIQRDTELRDNYVYVPEHAQRDYDEKAAMKGAPLKIGKDYALVAYIEDRMITHRYSPAAVLGEIKAQGLLFETTISHTTLYRYYSCTQQ